MNKTSQIKPIEISLETILDSIYDIQLDKYSEYEVYSFDEQFKPDKEDISRFIDLAKDNTIGFNPDSSTNAELVDLTRLAMLYRLETSYMEDTVKTMLNELPNIIIQDFKDVNNSVMYDDIQFDLYSDVTSIQEQEHIINESFTITYDDKKQTFLFGGSIEKLAYSIIAAIHGMGNFRYSSLQEFCDINEEDELTPEILEKTIIAHIFWFESWNNVYHDGTFSYNNEKLSDSLNRRNFGDYNFKKDDVINALNNM